MTYLVTVRLVINMEISKQQMINQISEIIEIEYDIYFRRDNWNICFSKDDWDRICTRHQKIIDRIYETTDYNEWSEIWALAQTKVIDRRDKIGGSNVKRKIG